MEHLYGETKTEKPIVKDLGVYLQYVSNHTLSQFHVFSPPRNRRHSLEIPFLASLLWKKNNKKNLIIWFCRLSDPAYNNRFTSGWRCCFTYSIPWENSVQTSQETSASPQQLMMSAGPCWYQIPPALSIIPCEITAIGYYCTNYDHVSCCHKA